MEGFPDFTKMSTDDIVVLLSWCVQSEHPLDKRLGSDLQAIIRSRKPESLSMSAFISQQPSVTGAIANALRDIA